MHDFITPKGYAVKGIKILLNSLFLAFHHRFCCCPRSSMERHCAAASRIAADEHQRRDAAIYSSYLPTYRSCFSSRPLVTSAQIIAPKHMHADPPREDSQPQTTLQVMRQEDGNDNFSMLDHAPPDICNSCNLVLKSDESEQPYVHAVANDNSCKVFFQPNIQMPSSGSATGYKYLHLKPRPFSDHFDLRRTKSASGISISISNSSDIQVLFKRVEDMPGKPKLCSIEEHPCPENEFSQPLKRNYPGFCLNTCMDDAENEAEETVATRQHFADKLFCCLPAFGRRKYSRP
ncbi:hypothetical protein O6H91_02G037600 [Diphasiastrum complanatum]|uniref:Uncharacterized protein n=1 Tax=Diphasiastrum complanatum TaxID=34168 RepID=A0ACC2EER6_DIPCM|nr:hypothetical protein O6H91_02G037600 [Diphasiastrum complanatum]